MTTKGSISDENVSVNQGFGWLREITEKGKGIISDEEYKLARNLLDRYEKDCRG